MAPDLVEEFVRTFQKEINLQRRDDEALHEAEDATSPSSNASPMASLTLLQTDCAPLAAAATR